jgi:phage recombination protein Bet
MEQKNIIETSNKDPEIDRLSYVQKTFPGLSTDDINLFLYTCKRTGLDPIFKQIYAIPRKGKMTIQTSIDGLRLIADRSGNYAAGKESTFLYEEKDGNRTLVSSTSYVKKKTTDGVWHEIAATAFFEEYKVSFYDKETRQEKLSDFWQRMPHVMLAKCAEALALRKAFPAELGGIFSTDEMEQADCDRLNADQQKEIKELIGEDKELLNRVLEGYGKKYKKPVISIADIQKKDFIPAVNALKRPIARQA